MFPTSRFAALACLALPLPALADSFSYAAFGGTGITARGYFTTTGDMKSNADFVGGSGTITASNVTVLGNLNNSPSLLLSGNLAVNLNATTGGFSSIHGNILAGGTLTNGGESFGDVTSGSDFTESIYSTVHGNIASGGNAALLNGANALGNVSTHGNLTLGQSVTVAGTAQYGGTLSQSALDTIGATLHAPFIPIITLPTPEVLHPADSFAAGSTPVTLGTFTDLTLAPGAYGALSLGNSSILRLSSGNYTFASIASPGTFPTLDFDFAGGPVNIYVAGDVTFKQLLVTIDGTDMSAVSPALAGNVLLESLGNVALSRSFFGTVFAPSGNITTATLTNVTGALVSNHGLDLGSSTTITFEPVPEPASLGLLAAGTVALLKARRRSTARR